MQISLVRILIILLVVNFTGTALKYFDYDRYLLLLGFRFHLSFVVPLFFILKKINKDDLKTFLIPANNFRLFPFILVIISIIIVTGVLYFFEIISIGDPEFFYEFGLSSVFDYPVYLIWNLPQLLSLFFFISIVIDKRNYKFLYSVIIISLLFLYEFIPHNNSVININDFLLVILFIFIATILNIYFKNIYSTVITFFTLVWSDFLIWGSKSETVTNILYASQYKQWEGFFSVIKLISGYVHFFIPFFVLLILSLSLFFIKKK